MYIFTISKFCSMLDNYCILLLSELIISFEPNLLHFDKLGLSRHYYIIGIKLFVNKLNEENTNY